MSYVYAETLFTKVWSSNQTLFKDTKSNSCTFSVTNRHQTYSVWRQKVRTTVLMLLCLPRSGDGELLPVSHDTPYESMRCCWSRFFWNAFKQRIRYFYLGHYVFRYCWCCQSQTTHFRRLTHQRWTGGRSAVSFMRCFREIFPLVTQPISPNTKFTPTLPKKNFVSGRDLDLDRRAYWGVFSTKIRQHDLHGREFRCYPVPSSFDKLVTPNHGVTTHRSKCRSPLPKPLCARRHNW